MATDALRSLAAKPADAVVLNTALRMLAKWRAEVVANTLAKRSGTRVLSGPFRGMEYGGVAEGSRTARLLGCYEAALHPVIEEIVTRGYPQVVDIGAAEGYYAVGLALRMPQTRVLARDSGARAQRLCQALAAANGVANRVTVGGLFAHGDFDLARAEPTVILCDIEGAEAELLDPVAAPGLLRADILVECHEGLVPGITRTLTDRFAASHRIQRLDRKLDPSALPDWMEELSDFDRLIALWEWRTSPTPWLWMRHR